MLAGGVGLCVPLLHVLGGLDLRVAPCDLLLDEVETLQHEDNNTSWRKMPANSLLGALPKSL